MSKIGRHVVWIVQRISPVQQNLSSECVKENTEEGTKTFLLNRTGESRRERLGIARAKRHLMERLGSSYS